MRPVEAVKAIMPSCRTEYLQAFDRGDSLLAAYGITTARRLAHFLAQFGAETGGGSILYENMNYSADRLVVIFGERHSAKVTRSEAVLLQHNPQAIAERVYGLGNPRKAKELGNTKPGDGWKYRGSGVLQTTGGYNFKMAGDKVGVNFYDNPTLIVSPEHALKPALWEWDHSGCNALADRGDILGISRAINLGNARAEGTPNGMNDRHTWFDRAWKVLKDQEIELIVGDLPKLPKPTPAANVVLPKPSTPAPPKPKTPAVTTTVATAGAAAGASTILNSSGYSSLTIAVVAASIVAIGVIIGVIWHERS